MPPAATSTPSKSSVGSDPLNQISCTAFDRFQNTLDNENHKCGFGDVLSWLCPFKLLIASDIHFKDRMSICCPAYPMKKDLSVIVSRQWASLPHHTPPPPPPTQGVPERWPHLRGALVSFLLLYFKHTQTLMMIKANAITWFISVFYVKHTEIKGLFYAFRSCLASMMKEFHTFSAISFIVI